MTDELARARDRSRGFLSRHPAVPYLIIIAAAAFALFWRLGLPTLEGHECYVPLVANHMAKSDRWLDEDFTVGPVPPDTPWNRWLVPVFNGRPRLVKTPLAYWCEAGMLRMGFPVSEFTARLPSAIAATLLALLVLALGRRLFSARAGLIAALMLLTTLGVQAWGRNARPEMLTTFWMTGVMFCFCAAVNASRPGRRHVLLMAVWFATGMANLAKEFVPWFLGLSLLAYLAWRASAARDDETHRPRRLLVVYLASSVLGLVLLNMVRATPALNWWTRVGLGEVPGIALTLAVTLGMPLAWYFLTTGAHRKLKPFLPTALPGALLMVLMFVPWLWYMTQLFSSAGAVLQSQVTERALSTDFSVEAKKPGFYCFALLVLALPWSVLLPTALVAPFLNRFRRHREALVFLLLWVFGLLLLFSAATGKRQHYILPALPPVCLLVGFLAEDLFFEHRWLSLGWAKAFVAGWVAVLVAGIAWVAAFRGPAHAAMRNVLLKDSGIPEGNVDAIVLHVLVIAGVVALFFVASLVAVWKGRSALALGMILLGAVAGTMVYATRADLWEEELDSVRVAKQALQMLPPDGRVASWGDVKSKVVYYFGRDIPDAWSRRNKLVSIHGHDKGLRLWKEWLESDRPPLLLFGHRDDTAELASVGFVPIPGDHPDQQNPREPMLFHLGKDLVPPLLAH
jgi:4-amino-4-deoxy-L-arabinose transferase-like glycosyltransferase